MFGPPATGPPGVGIRAETAAIFCVARTRPPTPLPTLSPEDFVSVVWKSCEKFSRLPDRSMSTVRSRRPAPRTALTWLSVALRHSRNLSYHASGRVEPPVPARQLCTQFRCVESFAASRGHHRGMHTGDRNARAQQMISQAKSKVHEWLGELREGEAPRRPQQPVAPKSTRRTAA